MTSGANALHALLFRTGNKLADPCMHLDGSRQVKLSRDHVGERQDVRALIQCFLAVEASSASRGLPSSTLRNVRTCICSLYRYTLTSMFGDFVMLKIELSVSRAIVLAWIPRKQRVLICSDGDYRV